MANEIQTNYAANKTLYAIIRNKSGQVWNVTNGAYESYLTASVASYAISLAQQGSASGYYTGSIPAAIPAGKLCIIAKEQTGGSVAETDPIVSMGNEDWSGSSLIALCELASSGQVAQFAPLRVARGNMIQNFPFKMVSAADHITAFTSGVVSGQISRDGGAFGALQSGAFSEVGKGWYTVNLTSGDLLANSIALVFSAVGVSGGSSDQRDLAFLTQRTSGY